MKYFASRMDHVPKSFIREILKVTENPEIISFAGGLPNPNLFPIKEIQEAAVKVLESDGKNVLQYSTTEGYYPLREYISKRYYEKHSLKIDPEEILITNGSQQALDLLGKIFINHSDQILIEKPGYLGAIQCFSLYQPQFRSVSLKEDGICLDELETVLKKDKIKFFYGVPNFQNPSGITYSLSNRKELAKLLTRYSVNFIEDNPYGDLRFIGNDIPPVRSFMEEGGILLGSFSKTVVPSFRIGWVCAQKEIMNKLVIAKQGADLHTNYFSQRVVMQYLTDYNIENHINKIKESYKKQREKMVEAIEAYFPKGISYTRPEGGMFLWVELPSFISSMKLFEKAVAENVVFVPGSPFYLEGGDNALRLNFSNSSEAVIDEGMRRLSKALKSFF
ncbi:MAG: aspartate aminotransferase [Spirochaetes bacterium GWB1_36_13]|nr:MAG: aspartate aminotransferase [Spirochaetes bacterium GWB1_36_13]